MGEGGDGGERGGWLGKGFSRNYGGKGRDGVVGKGADGPGRVGERSLMGMMGGRGEIGW